MIFNIQGYFIDDKTPIDSLVAEFDNTPEGYSDDDIFYYGLSEEDIKAAIKTKQPVDDFIITGYEVVKE